MRLLLAFVFLIWALPGAGHAAEYEIDYDNSYIAFSGTHAGDTFQGEFKNWQADIYFNPDDLQNSRINARFDMAGAETGKPLYDGTLPQKDWFSVKEFPYSEFVAKNIIDEGAGNYLVTGDLTIRDITHEQAFIISLSDLPEEAGGRVNVSGKLTIDRLAFDIGRQSDEKAEWVSREIEVELSLTAVKN